MALEPEFEPGIKKSSYPCPKITVCLPRDLNPQLFIYVCIKLLNTGSYKICAYLIVLCVSAVIIIVIPRANFSYAEMYV